jgi:hypothetical protein
MTVVIVGFADQPEFGLVADAVEERGGTAIICDVADWPSEDTLKYEPGSDEAVFGSHIEFEDVTGAYVASHHVFHPTDPAFTESLQEHVRPTLNQLREHRGLFESLCGTLEQYADVIVPLENHYWQDRKPLQLHLYDREGVPIPDTLFTNDPDEVRSFYDGHEQVVYKPITKGAVPKKLTEEDLDERLDDLATAPVQFQEFVEGEDLRVYVLDGEVIGAARYESEYFSFQHAVVEGKGEEVEIEPITVSDELEDALLRAADVTGFTFAAADVRRRPDGTYALLELNEAPRFVAPDKHADLGVSDALAEYLL